jgi:transposase-like protein
MNDTPRKWRRWTQVNAYVRYLGIVSKKMKKTVLTCPQCGSADLYYETAFITGQKYHCKKCDYVGSFVIEKDVEMGDEAER